MKIPFPPPPLFANSIRLDFAAEDYDRGNPSPLYDSCELLLSEVCQTAETPISLHSPIHSPATSENGKKKEKHLYPNVERDIWANSLRLNETLSIEEWVASASTKKRVSHTVTWYARNCEGSLKNA